MTSALDASRSRSCLAEDVVDFVCERLSLAVVAIGTIVMVLVFVVVEDNATHIGYYPIVFEHNDNRIEVAPDATSARDALRTGDRVDLQALTQPQRFALLRGRARKVDHHPAGHARRPPVHRAT